MSELLIEVVVDKCSVVMKRSLKRRCRRLSSVVFCRIGNYRFGGGGRCAGFSASDWTLMFVGWLVSPLDISYVFGAHSACSFLVLLTLLDAKRLCIHLRMDCYRIVNIQIQQQCRWARIPHCVCSVDSECVNLRVTLHISSEISLSRK